MIYHFIVVVFLIQLSASVPQLFWIESSTGPVNILRQADLTGTLKTALIENNFAAFSIRYDPKTDNLFWWQISPSGYNADLNKQKLSKLNQDKRSVLVNTNFVNNYQCIAVDRVAGTVYYAIGGIISKGTFGLNDAFNLLDLTSLFQVNIRIFEVDGGFAYAYVDNYATGYAEFQKISLTDSSVDPVTFYAFPEGSTVQSLALDRVSKHVYFSFTHADELGNNLFSIIKFDYLGNNETIYTNNGTDFFGAIADIRVGGGRIYFLTTNTNQLRSIDEFGGNLTSHFVYPSGYLYGFDIDVDSDTVVLSALDSTIGGYTAVKTDFTGSTFTLMYTPSLTSPRALVTVDQKLYIADLNNLNIILRNIELNSVLKNLVSAAIDGTFYYYLNSAQYLASKNTLYFGYYFSLATVALDDLTFTSYSASQNILDLVFDANEVLYYSSPQSIGYYNLTSSAPTIVTIITPHLSSTVNSFQVTDGVIYWNFGNKLYQAIIDGGRPKVLSENLSLSGSYVAIDPVEGYVVYASTSGSGVLNVAFLNGTIVRSFYVGQTISCLKYIPALGAMAVGTADGYVLLISTNYSAVETTYPQAGSYDDVSDIVYHSSGYFYASVRRDLYKIDEVSAQVVGSPFVRGAIMELDEVSGVIYYVDLFWDDLYSYDIASSTSTDLNDIDGRETLLIGSDGGFFYFLDSSYSAFKQISFPTVLSVDRQINEIMPNTLANPESIFLDGQFLYYGDSSIGKIQRVNLQTLVVETVYVVPTASYCFVYAGSFKIAKHPTQPKLYFNMRCLSNLGIYTNGIYVINDYTVTDGSATATFLHSYDYFYIQDLVVADATPVSLILGVNEGTTGGTSGGGTGGETTGGPVDTDTNDTIVPANSPSLLLSILTLLSLLML